MKSVDILFRIDPDKNVILGNMGGEGELNENPVDFGIGIQLVHPLHHRFPGGIMGQVDFWSMNPRFLAGVPFVFDVGMASRIISDKDDSEARGPSGQRRKLPDLFCLFCPQCRGKLFSIQNCRQWISPKEVGEDYGWDDFLDPVFRGP
jgi:hypothetical protein